ncbi:hypothetical protein VTI74DRAFT_1424 [Chaetomium olivicolor]
MLQVSNGFSLSDVSHLQPGALASVMRFLNPLANFNSGLAASLGPGLDLPDRASGKNNVISRTNVIDC